MRQNHDVKHLEVHYRRLYIDLNTLELDVSLSLLKYLCSLFIEKNFNSPVPTVDDVYYVQSVVVPVKVLQVPCVKQVVNFVCTTLKENKRELCIDLHSKASLAILLPSFARRTFILVVEAVSRHSLYANIQFFYALMCTDFFSA